MKRQTEKGKNGGKPHDPFRKTSLGKAEILKIKKMVALETSRLKPGLKKIRSRHPSEKLIIDIFNEMRKMKPDIKMINGLKSRLEIEAQDLKAKLARINKIIQLETQLHGTEAFRNNLGHMALKQEIDGMLDLDKELLKQIEEKIRRRSRHWQQ